MVDMLRISKLTTENMEGNCITDNPHPVFAFAVKSDNTEVLLRCAVLSVNGWTIETTQQTGIVYGGEPLTVFEGDRMIRSDSKVIPGEGASVKVVCYDGKTHTIKLQ